MHRIIMLASLAIVLVGITVAAAQQGRNVMIYTLEPDTQCALWLQMRMSAAADTAGMVDAIRSFYISGVRAALPAAGVYPRRPTQLWTSANSVVVAALDAACAQQPAKPIAHVLLNLLGYR